jgi:thiamine-phosphate diphosphorylase
MPFDAARITLIVITDRQILARGSDMPMADAVRAAAAGGATMIQLREKGMESAALLRQADELRAALEGSGCVFTVNDRLDIAMASGAEGVHLGQSDLPLSRARRVGGERLVYGVSAGKIEWAREAAAGGADYIGVGPIYPTGSKENVRAPIGPEGMAEVIADAGGLPAVAIGGMNAENLGPIIAAGASGVAVIGAVMGAPGPEAAAREIRRRIEEAKG